MKIVIRVDASSIIGVGHVMRCIALADEIVRQNSDVIFICRELDGDMNEFISSKGYEVIILPQQSSVDKSDICLEDDANTTIAILKNIGVVDWLIVDHYKIDKQWELLVCDFANNIMVIDDLADRPHHCDILLDQNYYSDMDVRYSNLLPKKCITLLGPTYVIFRQEFRDKCIEPRSRTGEINTILLFLGGGDSENVTGKCIKSLQMLNVPEINVDVIVGSSNSLKGEIKNICDELSNFNYYCQTERMAEFIDNADLCIGAGGTTTWERGLLGCPALTIICAENQYRTTIDLDNIGAIKCVGRTEDVTSELIYDELNDLIGDNTKVQALSNNIQKIMGNNNGNGASQIIELMVSRMNF